MQADLVQEIQGLYGPFTLTERVVQKIWLRQDLETSHLSTECGKRLEVFNPGRWNLLGGPDFKDARLLIDGQSVLGDVEVHFSSSDWYAHQHDVNPEFNRVVLHVVLYADREGAQAVRTQSGYEPPLVVLMPLLNRDLESYATDEALLEMEKVDDLEWVASFLEKPVEQRMATMQQYALKRWKGKVEFARKRLESTNWREACHQYCLEVLGYSRNRAPMSHLALRYTLDEMRLSDYGAEALYEEESANWKLSGLRPANHPLKRLQQYLEILQSKPDWPMDLYQFLQEAPHLETRLTTSAARKSLQRADSVDALRMDLFAGQVGVSRFHTMMVDAFLPLAEAEGCLDAQSCWWHWWAGDCPDVVKRFLKHAELSGANQPINNGLVQGALALFMNRDA